ncbi:6157_t:CDS:1, partial [Scutellospora calospora]
MSTIVTYVPTSAPTCHEQESLPQLPQYSSRIKLNFLFTKEFLITFLLGQFLSLCIASTIVATAELNLDIPTTQTFFTYFLLFLICTPITIFKNGPAEFLKIMKTKSWK